MIYIWNFHVLSDLLLIYICKIHWNSLLQPRGSDVQMPLLLQILVSPNLSLPNPILFLQNLNIVFVFQRKSFETYPDFFFHIASSIVRRAFNTSNEVIDSFVCGKLHLIYIWNFHVLNYLLLIYICKLHWNLNTMFVCQVIFFWFTYVISMF